MSELQQIVDIIKAYGPKYATKEILDRLERVIKLYNEGIFDEDDIFFYI